jgi:hypothetical protein
MPQSASGGRQTIQSLPGHEQPVIDRSKPPGINPGLYGALGNVSFFCHDNVNNIINTITCVVLLSFPARGNLHYLYGFKVRKKHCLNLPCAITLSPSRRFFLPSALNNKKTFS